MTLFRGERHAGSFALCTIYTMRDLIYSEVVATLHLLSIDLQVSDHLFPAEHLHFRNSGKLHQDTRQG